MSARGRYRIFSLVFDMGDMTEGDFADFRRDIDRLEETHPGAMLIGNDETDSWPTITVKETRKAGDQ